MQYSDTSTLQGIIEGITFRAGADTTTFPVAARTRYANEALNKVASIIIKADGRMQWDDTNHTDQPKATFDLVANQQDYDVFQAIPTALQDWLQVERVEILDSSDNGILLRPIDHRTIGVAMSEYKKVASIPDEFDFNGTSVFLYSKPNYSKTAGCTIWFKRAPSLFDADDTTKLPGFASIFHSYIEIYVSCVWKSTKLHDYSLEPKLKEMEAEIAAFYARRPKYERPTLSRAYQRYK